MSERVPKPPGKLATLVMALIGVILLLPGICVIVLAGRLLSDGSISFKDPLEQMLLMFWAVCFAVSIGGLLLLRAAFRRSTAAETP